MNVNESCAHLELAETLLVEQWQFPKELAKIIRSYDDLQLLLDGIYLHHVLKDLPYMLKQKLLSGSKRVQDSLPWTKPIRSRRGTSKGTVTTITTCLRDFLRVYTFQDSQLHQMIQRLVPHSNKTTVNVQPGTVEEEAKSDSDCCSQEESDSDDCSDCSQHIGSCEDIGVCGDCGPRGPRGEQGPSDPCPKDTRNECNSTLEPNEVKTEDAIERKEENDCDCQEQIDIQGKKAGPYHGGKEGPLHDHQEQSDSDDSDQDNRCCRRKKTDQVSVRTVVEIAKEEESAIINYLNQALEYTRDKDKQVLEYSLMYPIQLGHIKHSLSFSEGITIKSLKNVLKYAARLDLFDRKRKQRGETVKSIGIDPKNHQLLVQFGDRQSTSEFQIKFCAEPVEDEDESSSEESSSSGDY